MGLPSITAKVAPGATNGGGGPYWIWSGVKAFCGEAAWTNSATADRQRTIPKVLVMNFLLPTDARNGFWGSGAHRYTAMPRRLPASWGRRHFFERRHASLLRPDYVRTASFAKKLWNFLLHRI